MDKKNEREVTDTVRSFYAKIAKKELDGCCTGSSCCGSDVSDIDIFNFSQKLGYSKQEVEQVPEGSYMGLGCGNPQAIASIKPGETVMDLGSGGGLDCFLAAGRVGDKGRVIGIDMTPEMIDRARQNALKGNYTNVEFRLGEIEKLPVDDCSVDVIISNCVINLSTDKGKVFKEAFRVLKPGGRLAISDIVAVMPIPEELKKDLKMYSGCISGAASIEELENILSQTGFKDIRINLKAESREFIREWAPGIKVEDLVVSADIEAVKPIN